MWRAHSQLTYRWPYQVRNFIKSRQKLAIDGENKRRRVVRNPRLDLPPTELIRTRRPFIPGRVPEESGIVETGMYVSLRPIEQIEKPSGPLRRETGPFSPEIHIRVFN